MVGSVRIEHSELTVQVWLYLEEKLGISISFWLGFDSAV